MSDKNEIIKRLDILEQVINKNHENGEDLFPKHWLILLQVKNDVNKTPAGESIKVKREVLESMNKIWKINKAIAKAGSASQFEQNTWQKIDEFLDTTGKAYNDITSAIRLFQASFVKDDGSEYSLSEAKKIIEDRTKNDKRNKGNNS